ncbi:alpha/beta hydrolase fold domain-containing protein [Sphingomonas sp. Y38-1Y]|uniref:alpha/beta hydrolase fold domain-containing protein n=1 Tax=Sphingomonas sp. Y38-1Y TaxID=3078265 RepID=UPI0028E56F03|nr:alpha/beta hydrolase fold domain-containing protein [Sphingomonas sp. Y38-1Y]
MIDIKDAPPRHARWISEASTARFARFADQARAPAGDVTAQRAHYDAINSVRLDVAMERYPVAIETRSIGGVTVHDVVPRQPARGTLICLHGGAFIWGAGAGALLEAVPVAATAGMRVLAVEYRLAPEHRFPAAVDDVLAVIAALREARDEPIGIYGCSAGGVLAAQVVARLIAEGQQPPAAIAMLHGSGVDVGGDSLATAALLNGAPGDIRRLHDLSYFDGTSPTDPLVFPGESAQGLADFPPSLLISGTRDFAASSVAVMHRRLLAAGVDAQFVLFDGMWHAHHVDTDLPEAQETHDLLGHFFRRQLSRA